MGLFDFDIADIDTQLARVDQRLRDYAPEHIPGAARLLSGSGKRLRPRFIIAIAHYSGKEIDETVIDAAAAVEFVHIASLVHDDIMDNGTLRWGMPTINAQEGRDAAILAGDHMLAKGFMLAARVNGEAGAVLADSIAALCEGQALEQADSFQTSRTEASLLQAIAGKTSSLFAAACVLGALVADLPVAEQQALRSFGEQFGVAFQYLDDVSDFTTLPEAAGKSVGNDIREGKYTLPVIFALQGAQGDRLRTLLQDGQSSGAEILSLLEEEQALERTTAEAVRYKQKAQHQLSTLSNTRLAEVLSRAVDYF